ncbi:hypothetical protein COBT_000829 [Conglomerata obtusa]
MATPRKRITFRTPIRKKQIKVKKNAYEAPIVKMNENKNNIINQQTNTYQNGVTESTNSKEKLQENYTRKKSAKKNKNREKKEDNKEKNESPEDIKHSKELEEYIEIIEAKGRAEMQLVEAYKNENIYLRSLKKETLAFKKFLGLELEEISENVHEFKWENLDQEISKRIIFRLIEDDLDFSYELIEFENVILPEALEGCINFDKCQLMKFFLNMYEILLSKN